MDKAEIAGQKLIIIRMLENNIPLDEVAQLNGFRWKRLNKFWRQKSISLRCKIKIEYSWTG